MAGSGCSPGSKRTASPENLTMPAKGSRYRVHCLCGNSIPVELPQAGSVLSCPKCAASVEVPRISELKQLAGDKYPWLSVWGKIANTLAAHEPPFDGNCQRCGERPADICVPIAFQSMQERRETDEPPKPVFYGLMEQPEYVEFWRKTTFPLLLCDSCHAQFQRERSKADLKRAAFWTVALAGGFGLIFWALAKINLDALPNDDRTLGLVQLLVKVFAGMAILVVGIGNLHGKRKRVRRGNASVIAWLTEVPLVQDLLEGEDEFRIHLGRSAPTRGKTSSTS